ncbi:MAG: glycosyltransferase family 2 protein [Patescibacteria group bacterium]
MQEKTLPISVIIITHRADKLFLDSLTSVQFAEEIIILDNNSNNNWSKLKKKFNFTVINYFKTIKDFSQIRNNLIKKARYEWVLFVDSDEILEKKAAEKILKIINKKNIDAAFITRVDYFLGKKLNWGEMRKVQKLRLAKKQQLKFWGTVHEIGNSPGNILRSNIIFNHYSHSSISSFLKKIIIYADIVSDYKKDKYQLWEVLIEMLINPPGKFVYNYILKLGFLDAWQGLVYAAMMSIHSATVRIMLYEKLSSKKYK